MEEQVKLQPFTVSDVQVETNEQTYGVRMVNAQALWTKTKGEGVVVAILDTGIATDHPDLQGRVIDGRNFTPDYNSDPKNFYDNNGHGTHVAGIIAANNDSKGIVGVAPESKLLIGKVLGAKGGGSYEGIIRGIKWAVDWRGPNGERARVINMSLGGPVDVPLLHQTIQYAVKNGVMVVVAAGNEGDGTIDVSEYSYPAYYEEVVEVGGVDSLKKLATFSDTNDQVDVCAPAVDIKSTYPSTTYKRLSGTSMATPHVSGAIALLIAAYETPEKPLTEPEVYELLLSNTEDLGINAKGEGKGLVYLKPFADSQPQEPVQDVAKIQATLQLAKDQLKTNIETLLGENVRAANIEIELVQYIKSVLYKD